MERKVKSWNEGGRTSGKFLARLGELPLTCLGVIRIAERVQVVRRRKRLNFARRANFVFLARLEKRAYISRERLLMIEMYRKRDSDESEN